MRSLRLTGLLVLTFVAGLTACGGGSSDSSSSSTTSTTKATKATARSTDPAGGDIAQAATVVSADLGAGWTEYRAVTGAQKISAEACNAKFGSPLGAADEAHGGAMYTDTTKKSFVYSFAIVFKTEAQAKAYTALRRTSEYLKCKEAEDDAAAKEADASAFVRMQDTAEAAVGTGTLESFYQEEAGGKDAAGADVVSATYSRYTYRVGRVVYTILIDSGLGADTAEAQAISERVSAALNESATAINTRLQALDT
ncbi:MAG: hypothetical protein ACXWZG_01050 [Microbacterium sp.]